ncbi:MAG: hypothetical protein Q9162_001662 [Coniocarpon cinnabarinum]
MSSEHTPLLERAPVAPSRQRYPHQTLRRACTAFLVTALAVGLPMIAYFVVTTPEKRADFASRVGLQKFHAARGFSYTELVDVLTRTPDEDQVREWSQFYTAGPHLMGQNKSQAEWTRDRWRDFGVEDAKLVEYEVYTNYPNGTNRLALLEDSSKVKYESKLAEDELDEDSTTNLLNRIPTFHGYSAAGNVTAQYVFCNYGAYQDFEELQRAGIDLEGKIAVVRYGHIFRGLKVKRAQEMGMVGVVMYTDPSEDGIQSWDPEDQYPNGPARNPSSVQRGSTQFLNTENAIPRIPSLPISYEDAIPILKALNGHGPDASAFSQYWQNGALRPKGVNYNIGPSPSSLTLNLVNNVHYVTTPIWNVIGVINGTNSDETLVMGNHRDAWIAGGAGDPNSGSAAFNEVIRSFGTALSKGWKPHRTIVLASWDGEEYGLVGSTEWVEEYLPWLSSSAIAYLNVDVGTRGTDFTAAAAPLLDSVLIDTTHAVASPNQSTKGQTVGDLWDRPIKTMGSGSDFTAFQDYAGVPSIDMGFGENPSADTTDKNPVYHYHSNYDSFHWMDTFGDPGWHYHVAIAKVWGVLAAKLVEAPVLPFNATNYAVALGKYADKVETMVEEAEKMTMPLRLTKLKEAIEGFRTTALAFDASARTLAKEMESDSRVTEMQFTKARRTNNAYKLLERQFLYEPGLDGRSWFKHTVFAPGLWTGYAGATFPGLVEAVDAGDAEAFYRWLDVLVRQVEGATGLLGG